MRSPVAMISYSSKDGDAAELIHDELALRCFEVIHDRHSFQDGGRVPASMERGVERCDVFVGYLTPHSLYLNAASRSPRPALEQELIPALQRRRASLGSGTRERPIVILVSHGLGNRATAGETVRRLTGEPADTLWSLSIDQDTDHITQPEAAELANRALQAFLATEPTGTAVTLSVTTRGTRPEPRRFTIDGTRLFGGERRPGDPANWTRFVTAANCVEQTLKASCGPGTVRIDAACHLSAALAVGRVFHQASGWSPAFSTRHGHATPSSMGRTARLRGDLDPYEASGDVIVDIDLIGHDVADRASRLATAMPRGGGRLSLSRSDAGDLSPTEISDLARGVADKIRSAHARLKPSTIHLMMAVPAAFAGLLGHHLSALQADIVAYELGDDSYAPAVTLRRTTP